MSPSVSPSDQYAIPEKRPVAVSPHPVRLGALPSLFEPRELAQICLPPPLDARPGIGSLADAGIRSKRTRLQPSPRSVREYMYRFQTDHFDRKVGRPAPRTAVGGGELHSVRPYPNRILTWGSDRDSTLQRLGVSPSHLALIPAFASFIPDVILVDNPATEGLSAIGDGRTPADCAGRTAALLVDNRRETRSGSQSKLRG